MATRWSKPTDTAWTIRLPRALALLLALGALAALVGVGVLYEENRALRADLAELAEETEVLRERERLLTSTIAEQHGEIQGHLDDAEALRFRLETVELQLDGVERIGRELRVEFGLADAPASGAPRGGPFDGAVSLTDRGDLARRRLAVGLSELLGLRDMMRARHAAEAAAAARDAAGDPPAAAVMPVPHVAEIPAGWPVPNVTQLSSGYGWRIFRGRPNFHTGLDIPLPHGTQVRATGAGTVVGAGWQPGYGHSVLLQHADGYNTLYAHLSGPLVRVGEEVRSQDPIGLSGSSGNSTGPHLHYEIWRDGTLVDPTDLTGASSAGGNAGR